MSDKPTVTHWCRECKDYVPCEWINAPCMVPMRLKCKAKGHFVEELWWEQI